MRGPALPDEVSAVDLERMALGALSSLFGRLNADCFYGKLRRPVFELMTTDGILGRWHRSTRTMGLNRALIFEQPWWMVTEVMKHELAHQFVDEVLGVRDETAHGPAFRAVCQDLRIDARAFGMPRNPSSPTSEEPEAIEASGPELGADADGRIIERISRLLRLASSSNQNEAEAATIAARRLMLKHNLDASATARRYTFRQLGRPSMRILEPARVLARILVDHFFVEALWVHVYRAREGKYGKVLEVFGTASNLAIAEYVYTFLTNASEALWRAHQQSLGTRSNRDRLSFLAGVMHGFRQKLAREEDDAKGEGLIWVGDSDLELDFHRRHPSVRRLHRSGVRRGEAFGHGRAAGERIILRKGVDGEMAESQGRLLEAGL